jgi:DNA processing protein
MPHDLDERSAWIALASVKGIGETIFGALMATFGGANDVFRATLDGRVRAWIAERRRIDGRPPVSEPTFRELEGVARDPTAPLRVIDDLGLWTTTPLDADYPARLRDLDPPPFAIHGLGDRAALDRPRAVAVVGTRRPTPAGRALTNRISIRLVECGATVVSGLAVGIDGVAHAAAIERTGTTVGVIGGGHCHPGPRAHARLREEVIAADGALISEYHPDTKASIGTYPRRNRVIAALADAVIVVEAPARSGALITARHGLDLGRQVLVAPGRVGDWAMAGSLALLRDSPTRPLVGLDEMVDDLGYFDRTVPVAEAEPAGATSDVPKREPALAMLGATERVVARRLCVGPAGLDILVADTGLGPAVVSSAVTILLMRGWAQAVGPAFIAAGPLAE